MPRRSLAALLPAAGLICSRSFQNFADDLNGKGVPDLIVFERLGERAVWYAKPGSAEGPWEKRLLAAICRQWEVKVVDIGGIGTRELVGLKARALQSHVCPARWSLGVSCNALRGGTPLKFLTPAPEPRCRCTAP